MGFIQDQVGLAEQAVKANEYDKLVAAIDAEHMAQSYKQQGAQEVISKLPELLAVNTVKQPTYNGLYGSVMTPEQRAYLEARKLQQFSDTTQPAPAVTPEMLKNAKPGFNLVNDRSKGN